MSGARDSSVRQLHPCPPGASSVSRRLDPSRARAGASENPEGSTKWATSSLGMGGGGCHTEDIQLESFARRRWGEEGHARDATQTHSSVLARRYARAQPVHESRGIAFSLVPMRPLEPDSDSSTLLSPPTQPKSRPPPSSTVGPMCNAPTRRRSRSARHVNGTGCPMECPDVPLRPSQV